MKTQQVTEKLAVKAKKECADYARLCEEAKRLEDSGCYEEASEVLGDLWRGVGEKPDLNGFPETIKAEVLIRIGSLSGWIGSARQIEGSQEKAKDLICEGIRILEDTGEAEKIAEAQSDLGVCYWREGAYAEAEVYQNDALSKAPVRNRTLRGKVILRLVNVAISKAQYESALKLLEKAAPMIEKSRDPLLLGKLYFHKALIFNCRYQDNELAEFSEKAIEHYKKASHHYSQAKHERYRAVTENNLGYHLFVARRFSLAHRHLDIAIKLFTKLEDVGRLAGAYDSKARVFLEQSKLIEAEVFSQKAVQLLRSGDEFVLLSISLSTLGTILARQHSYEQAAASFEQAVEKALYMEDSENAGLAMLAQFEALNTVLSEDEKSKLLLETKKRLGNTESRSIVKRLEAAESICRENGDNVNWDNFSLSDAVLEFEAGFITKALKQTGGKVTKAAELLGLTHQNLSLMLKKRHHELAAIKKPRRARSDRKKPKRSSSRRKLK